MDVRGTDGGVHVHHNPDLVNHRLRALVEHFVGGARGRGKREFLVHSPRVFHNFDLLRRHNDGRVILLVLHGRKGSYKMSRKHVFYYLQPLALHTGHGDIGVTTGPR